MNFSLAALGLGLGCFLGGCATDVDSDSPSEDGVESAADELTTSGIKGIEAWQSPGFRPPPEDGSCIPAGRWNVDFTTRKLTGEACIGGTPVTIDRELSADELKVVKTQVSKVRIAPRPTACPTDVPSNGLMVRKARSAASYVDARAACGELPVTPVKERTLSPLVDLLTLLSAPIGPVTPDPGTPDPLVVRP